MELERIQTYLDSPNPQERMRAIVNLRSYTPEVVVPLLKRRMYDKEFLIRSFVAMGLGHKQTEEGFEMLVQLLESDSDPNVRAEAANSIAKYGDRSLPYLFELFVGDSHWLVRQSILAAMEEIDCPEILCQMCILGIQGDDPVVRLAAIANLAKLQRTSQADNALEILLSLAAAPGVEIRAEVAKVLRFFDDLQAQAALAELRHDPDYRVVAATLEGLL
jgi:HEAT repeat protein